MKSYTGMVFGVLLAVSATVALGAGPIVFTPASLHWVPGTAAAKDTSAAVLTGNPAKTGYAILRVKMPDGHVNQPHYHSHPEYITVMSGALLFGTGDAVSKDKATLLPAGSFIAVPAGEHHWSVAKGETIEQISGEGPIVNIPIKHGSM